MIRKTFVAIASAAALVLCAPTVAVPMLTPGVTETFGSYSKGTWKQGTTHKNWSVKFNGYGRVWVQEFSSGGKVLNLRPTINPPSTGTSAALVQSTTRTSGDVTLSLRMRTVRQNATYRNPAETPNAWETAWVWWNHDYKPGSGDEGTGKDISEVASGYYLTLKPNGWELGKIDQGRFVGIGGQRYLATGTTPRYPIGTKWRNVVIQQRGATITVTVDGVRLTQFTDGPGSGGYPGWSAHANQEVYRSGKVGLYTEDAHVQFDNVRITQ